MTKREAGFETMSWAEMLVYMQDVFYGKRKVWDKSMYLSVRRDVDGSIRIYTSTNLSAFIKENQSWFAGFILNDAPANDWHVWRGIHPPPWEITE